MEVVSAGRTVQDLDNMLVGNTIKTPGIKCRELMRLTGLSNGVLSYHLSVLERSNCIKVERLRRTTRYYLLDIPTDEQNIITWVRQRTARKMIMFILDHDTCTFKKIVEYIVKARLLYLGILGDLENRE